MTTVESHLKPEVFLEALTESALIVDDALEVLSLNERAASLLESARHQLEGQCLSGFLLDERPLRSRISGSTSKEDFRCELTLRTRKGTVIPITASVGAMNQGARRYLMTFKEIYEIQEEQEPIRQSQRNYRELFENSGEALFIHDPETHEILDVNQRMCELYGYSRQEATSLTLGDLSSGEEPFTQEKASEYLEEAKETGLKSFEWQARRKDGSTFWVEVRLKPVTIDYSDRILASVRDITERKINAGLIRAREKQFRQLFNSTAQALLLVDDAGRIGLLNDPAEEMFGYPSEELIGSKIERLVPEERREDYQRLRERYLGDPSEQELGFDQELKAVRRNGERFPCEVTLSPFQVEGSRQILVSVKDISKRKQIRNRLTRLTEASNDVLCMFNGDWTKLLFINSSYERIYGQSPAKLEEEDPRAFLEAVHPEDRNRVRSAMARLESGESVDLEYRVNESEGFNRWVWINAEAVKDNEGEVIQIVGVARDVTERRQDREELELKNHAMDSVHDGIIITDNRDSNAVIYCNEGFENLTGYDRDEVIGRNCRFLQGPETDPETVERLREAIDAEEPISLEIKNYRKDGTTFWNLLSITPVRTTSDGAASHFIGILKDISERKKIEEELRERTEALKASNTELKNYANIVTHDLKQPLRTITSYVDLLNQKYDQELTEEARNHLDRITSGTRAMKDLLDRLRDFSKVNFSDPDFRPVDLNQVIDTALENLNCDTSESEVDLSVDSLPAVVGDEPLLEDLFRNLIDNAITYCDGRPEVTIRQSETPDYHVIEVEDNGIGIEPEYFDRIFEIFERLQTDGGISGTEIGLAICHKITDLHDGWIDVESTPGEGSTFQVGLPKKQATPISDDEGGDPDNDILRTTSGGG
ncbi:MAG: PAS domain S-box protein [bacterium]